MQVTQGLDVKVTRINSQNMPDDYLVDVRDYYFPINLSQVEDILGKMLTHVEAMNLPSTVEKANKDLVRQTVWKWYDGVQENSLTSYKGCIAPIKVKTIRPEKAE